MFAAQAQDPERPIGRGALARIIGIWANRRGVKTQVVFDGPPPQGPLFDQIAADGVTVAFSGSGVSADERIARILERHSGPRHLVVVSSDREIAAAARRRGAASLKSDEFWAGIRRELARPNPPQLEPPEKQGGLSGPETDRWLKDLGFESPPSDQDDADWMP
jgi:hypothetical protein